MENFNCCGKWQLQVEMAEEFHQVATAVSTDKFLFLRYSLATVDRLIDETIEDTFFVNNFQFI